MADHLRSESDDLGLPAVASTFLTFTPDELAIVTAAADVIEGVLPISRLHAECGADINDQRRRELGRLGWFALALPEAQGGSDLSAVETALFFREVGRRCGPIDILALSLAAVVAENDATLQARLVAGEVGVCLAVRDGEGVRVLGALDSELAVIVERDGAAILELSKLTCEVRPSLDPGTSMRVAAGGLPQSALLARRTGDGAWNLGQAATAAMMVGLAEAALDLIVGYAAVRETFGRKIGAYQAVRHPCADMAMRAEAARSQLWYATASDKAGRGDAGAHLDAAKHLANVAAVTNADVNIQLHGGIGITDEHDAHLLLKRGLLLSQLFGSKRELMSRLLHAELQD